MNSAALAVELATENNPEAVDELCQQKASSLRNEAIKMLRLALSQAGPGDDPEDVCAARYFLAWLYWEEGRPHEAAVLGEHSWRPVTPTASTLPARRSWRWRPTRNCSSRRSAAGDADTSFESGRIVRDLARMIAERWPESPEAAASVTMLVNIALSEGRVDDAFKLLDKVAEDGRAAAELALG